MSIKAVLDTNVVVSGLFWSGPPFRILRAWQQQRFTLVASTAILDEYRRVTEEIATRYSFSGLSDVLEIIELHSELVLPVSFAKPICTDPDDDTFLEAAIAARADYVVSGDAALLAIKNYQGIRMLRAAQFLKVLL